MKHRSHGDTRRARDEGREDGQILLLVVGYALVAVLLVSVVASATAVHLERKRLLALADLVALEAADALDPALYYAGDQGVPGAGSPVVLTPDGVRAAVESHLASAPEAARFRGLEVVEATTDDGRTARVTLRATADVPLVTLVTAPWSDGVDLLVTSRARAG